MKIEGYDDDQIAAICDIWKLGKPIDVSAFLERSDIPADAKARVRKAGESLREKTDAEAGKLWRLMQAQIIIEVVSLDKQRWNLGQ